MKNKAARIILTITASMFIGASIVPLPIRGYALETKQEKEEDKIAVDTIAEKSVTLKVDAGYVYAIQTKDKDGKNVWKWADLKQYSEVKDGDKKGLTLVTFSDLEPDTDYIFAKKPFWKLESEESIITGTIHTKKIETQSSKETEGKKESGAAKETEGKKETVSVKETESKKETESVKEAESKKETESVKETESKKETESVKETESKKETESVKETESKKETESVKETENKKETESVKETESKKETESVKETESKKETESVKETENKKETESVKETETKPVEKVDPPSLKERAETSIALQDVKDAEYGIKKEDGTYNWQTSGVFDNLTTNTEYFFKIRMISGAESEEVMYKTLIPFEGSVITGIAEGASYVSGTKLTATAVGNGMDNVNPSDGDSRWIPRSWDWGREAYKDWKEPGYSTTFTLVEVGKYRMTVEFEREEYSKDVWKSTGVLKKTSVQFKVTEAETANYTITATAGANGSIDPQGNITVEKGNDIAFTFKPNNGYQVSKVYVDGRETPIAANSFSFKKVNANHTLSVTFEQAKKIDSPKTGDEMKSKPVIAIMAVSGIILIGIVLYTIKKKK